MANSAIVGVLRALLMADTAQFDSAMKRSADTAKVWSRDMQTMGRQATQLGAALTKTITLPLVAMAGASAKAAIDFESSFAGVRKTVNATEPEFKALAQAFRDLAKQIPIDVNELNKLGEAAGALGIPKQEIVKFTEVMAKLGVTTNVTAEEAATSIAQIQNVFQAAGKDSDRFASALVDLGNKGASTEKDILSLANRLASAGRAINLSQADVLGFAAALANVGIEAEAGGTALSKVFADISIAVSEGGQELEAFASTAKMSSAQFADLFKKDAAAAVTAFVEGIGKAKAEGKDLNIVLKELGFTEVRQARALRDLALSGENLATSIKTSNDAWKANAALSKEAAERFKTTESQLTLLWNRIKDVGITIGNAMLPAIKSLISVFNVLLPIVDTLAKGFAALPGGVQLAVLGFGALVASAGPLLFVAGQLITATGQVVAAFAKGGLAAKGLAAANDLLAASNARLGASFVRLLGAASAITAGFVVGAGIASMHEQHLANLAKASDDLADANAKVAAKEAELAQAMQHSNDGLVYKLTHELKALKVGRDRTQQIHDEAKAEEALALERAKAGEFVGPMASGESAKNVVAEAFKATNEKIRKEIANTKLSVGELTKMLDEQGVAFKASAGTMGLSATTVQFLEEQLQKQKKATAESSKATKELTKDVEAQWKQLEKWGIVTRDSVNKQLGELTDGFMAALAQGVPLDKAIALMQPHFEKLAESAKASGINVKELAAQMEVFARALPTPKRDSLTLIGGGTESLMKVGVVLKDITAASLGAHAQQIRTNQAFEAFGLKTPQELAKVAQAARDNFRALAESGLASTSQLKAAWDTVLEAERAMAGESVSIWKTQIFPAVKGVLETLTAAVNGSFAQMTLGAKSFKEGFVDIWESLKASILNILNSILSAFTNQFLKGLIGAMSGQGGAFGKAFSSMVGGGRGGMNWAGMAQNALGIGGAAGLSGAGYGAAGLAASGLPASGISAGGGFAGAFGGGGGAAAGLSSAALIGITAGIGAAVVAGIILYQRNKNTTKGGREEFAKDLGFTNEKGKGDLGALYKNLETMGGRGVELAHIGRSVIGKKDEEANRKWMQDVTTFMEAVKQFTSVVTSATGRIAAGFTSKISNVIQKQTKDTIASYDQQIDAARDNADEVKRLEDEKAAYIKSAQAEVVANTQTEFDRISRITLGAFTAARAQGQSAVEAVQTVGPAIDELAASAEAFGFAGNAAFEQLLRWRELTSANAPLLDSVAGLVDLMKIMADTGHLDQQMFKDLQAQGLEAYKSLIEAGFTEAEARAAIKPLLLEEIRLAKEKGFAIDEGTAAIIAQMRANGELQGEEKKLVDVFIQGFGALLKFLKVDLPAGWDATAAAGEEAAERTDRAWQGKRYNVRIDYETGDVPAPPDVPGGILVPGAAEGGIFTRPSIIGIGEAGPEAAIPLNRLRDFGIGTSLNNMYASIDVYMDGRRVAENQIRHLKFAAKRIGVRPI